MAAQVKKSVIIKDDDLKDAYELKAEDGYVQIQVKRFKLNPPKVSILDLDEALKELSSGQG